MNNRIIKIYTFIMAISATITIDAQYISSITAPDTTIAISSDTSDIAVKIANTITAADIKVHLDILASDEYEGRETGKEGNRKAAQYIANHYDQLGLPNIGDDGKFQKVAFTWSKWDEKSIYVNDNRYKYLWDFLAFPARNNGLDSLKTDEVHFIGYGIDDPAYSDYKKKDYRGKVVLFFDGEPKNKVGKYHITSSDVPSKWSKDINTKLRTAYDKGVALALIITPDIKEMLGRNRSRLLSPQMELGDKSERTVDLVNHAYISTTIAKDIWGKKEKKVLKARNKANKKGKAKQVKLSTKLDVKLQKGIKTLFGENVLGYVEGTDLKDEVVVVSAHFDHLGKRGDDIYNGADDNGSGTSAILDMAEAFSIAKKMNAGPRRSVLFLNVTGEEKGLLGSAYYADNPIFPLENTVVDVNVDMIGRVDEKYANNPNYIYVIGSDRLSTELHKINESVNQKYSQLMLDYTYNSEQDPNRYYYRSDHYNFAEKGIPAIFYFSGVHRDYHMTTDTPEKIMFDKMEKVTRLIFHTTWQLANQDKRIEVDVKK